MLRVVILGAGNMGRVHAAAWATISDVRVVAVAEADTARAGEVAGRSGASIHGSLPDVLAATQADVVDICLPTPLHPDAVLEVAAAGLNVICEKPLALDPAKAEEMIRACRRAGVQLLPAMVVRFFPQYQALARAVEAGEIGRPVACTLVRQGFYPTGSDAWYRDQSRSGGIFLDLMIHDFDWALRHFGPAERVYAAVNGSRTDYAFAQGTATVHHRSGVMSQITGTWGHPGPFSTAVEIVGTEGLLQYSSQDSEALHLMAPPAGESGDVPLPNLATAENPYRTELEHFRDVIVGTAQPIVTAEESLNALRLATSAVRSAAEGQAVTVPEGEA